MPGSPNTGPATIIGALQETFHRTFSQEAQIFRAPGRVNLIGEHTDYNGGFVMPAAVGFYTWVAVSPREDSKFIVRSENFNDQVEYSIDALPAAKSRGWSDYVVGVAKILLGAGRELHGVNMLIQGTVPLGAGLSSSASLEVAVASALEGIAGIHSDRKELALLCQRAENEFVGARCGIMDQFIAAHGQEDHALLLDCRSLEYRYLPLATRARLVICNTMVRHSVAAGEYNTRRLECEEAVRLLRKHDPDMRSLRDVPVSELDTSLPMLPSPLMQRCRHVVTENARVEQAAGALERGDLQEFGDLMQQSHVSLRDDYEVSCPELDLMVELAQKEEGVYGARMTGGGFGGCTVNLVKADFAERFKTAVSIGYTSATGVAPEIYICSAVDGVTRVR